MKPTRRHVLAGAALLLPGTAHAAEWPERPIRMIIPFAPGAGADIVGRTFAEELAKALGQPMVVDNKGGAGGLLGTAEGARAAPDGYTLMLTSQGTMAWNLGMYKAPGYDPLKDFVPVTVTGALPNTLVISATNPANSVADLIAQAKAKPGELTYGSSGVGSSLHLSGVIFEQRTGIRLQHVPYRGAPAAVLAVINGEVTMGFCNTPTVLPQIKAGKLKALAVTSRERSPLMPELPTMMQAGVADFDVAVWLGFAVPANTPAAIVTRLNTEINRISQNPQVREKLLIQGFEMMPPISAAAARKTIEDDQAYWLPIIKQSGATAE
ncbi:MAG: tripartite tricarboxylate transporter substrate binding protein [Reyranella sp.]|nr:tripartite tricarboxylate transporter substrate binding protein [Reyranella sp.]